MKSIAAALAKAQAEMGNALKDSDNPHFKSKYADLASVRDACLPALNRHGIAVIQPFVETELGRAVKTVLLHESGETLECAVPVILGKQDMQGLGSAITYARRYGLLSMAGIAPEDDDGNAAAASVRENPTASALKDAWTQGVLDSIPETATQREKAEAFAKAMVRDFNAKTGERALSNEWDRRKKMIETFESRFPDLHEMVVDAYENRMMDIAPREAAE